ncbi:MAG: M23 family metallopeptidase [Acidimicrobiia bacterium]|nr:MAG: M23 family metallopeptidase [Acidimicrobiia bacterium]
MIRRLSFLAFSLLFLLTSVVPAISGDLDSDLSNLRSRISALRGQIDEAAAERSDLAKDVLAAGDRLETAEAAVAGAKSKLERVERDLTERTAALDDVRVELAARFVQLAETRETRDKARDEAESWATRAYMGGGTAQPSIAFSASSIVEISVGVAYLDVLTRYSSSAADRFAAMVATEEREEAEVRALETSVVEDIGALDDTKAEAVMLAADLDAKREGLAAEYEAQSALLAKVDAAVEQFEGELASLGRQEKSIRREIAAAAAAAAATAARGSRPGRLVRPVPGAIESGFGPRVHPIFGTTRMHNGLDMHGDFGVPIKAAASGTVIFVGVKGGFGNAVMIDHGGGMVTLYAHQSKLGVKTGQRVKAGQIIGWIGSSGLSTGPHLHFEVRINGSPVDPSKYL